jgi:transcriptional regulator
MSTKKRERTDLLQGTLDLLILRTLTLGRQHGHGIARAIQARSSEALIVETGSLYPALQRLEDRHWIRAEWGVSENNRKARFYELTTVGRRQLSRETSEWHRLVKAVGLILTSGVTGG